MAQLVTANPKLISKSPAQELSESVVKVSGKSKFTRLDVREQWQPYAVWDIGMKYVGIIIEPGGLTQCHQGNVDT